MIYANHNFTANFLNATSFDDSMMVRNMIIDELARLIVENKKDIVNILRKENLNVTINDDNNTISQVLTKEIVNGNNKVIDAISKLISDNEFDSDEAKNFVNLFGIGKNKDGTTDTKKKGVFKEKLGSFLKKDSTKEGLSELIALGLKKSFDKSKAKQTDQSKAVLTERLKLNEMKNAKSKKSKKKTLIIVGVVSFIIIALATTVLLIRNSSGGRVSSPSPSPSPSPTIE